MKRVQFNDRHAVNQTLKVHLPYGDDLCCVYDGDSLFCDGRHGSNRII